jgi:phage N-6-adenine-methyltransferase
MTLIKSMVSSKSNEWSTPQRLFDYLDNIFNFTLDPRSTNENAKCKKHFTIEDDGLSNKWDNEIVFMNPPYGGNTAKWLEKAKQQMGQGTTTVCLIVSSTDRSYWHDIIDKYADEIWFLRGRIKFGDKKTTAPFASAIVIFRPNSNRGLTKFIDIREIFRS